MPEAAGRVLESINLGQFSPMMRSVAKAAAWAVLSPITLILLYGLVAFVCALLPVMGRPQALAADDPPLFVCASPAHSDIVVSLSDEAGGWRGAFFAVAGDVPGSAYIAIGWGDLGFYQDT